MKVGRNDPCICGSGKKFKKCCLGKDALVLCEDDRNAMRRAGRFNAELMAYLRPLVVPGITTLALDKLAHEYTVGHGHVPASLGYSAASLPHTFRLKDGLTVNALAFFKKDYPASICTSINDVVCHGIPDDTVIKDGDIINFLTNV